MRKFRSLGVVMVAVVAITAVIASAAQASRFTAGASSGTIKATQLGEEVFTTTAGTVKCSTAIQEGAYSASEFESLEASATFGGCKAFGFISATVNMGNCKFKYTGAGQAAGTTLVDIVCTSGDITVTTLSCTVHIPAQTGTPHIVFVVISGPPDDLVAITTISGIEYTETSGCPNVAETKTTTNGTVTGEGTIRAFNTSGTQVNLRAD